MNISHLSGALRATWLAIGLMLAGPAVSQSGMTLPLEEVGVVRQVDAARSMITVDKRQLQVTTATQISADDPNLRYSGVSDAWLGRQVGMETNVAPDGTTVVVKLHIFNSSH